jgi:hypothetical protein
VAARAVEAGAQDAPSKVGSTPETAEAIERLACAGLTEGMRAFRQAARAAWPSYRLLWEVAHR